MRPGAGEQEISFDYIYQVAQKCFTGRNTFSRQPTEIFYQDLQRKDFSRVLENFTEIVSRITTFTMFYFVFQNYAEEILRNKQSLVMFIVQRR